MDHTLTAIRKLNIAILFIEHDMDIIRRYSKRVLAFYSGKIIADGEPQKGFRTKRCTQFIVGKSDVKS